MRNSLWIVLFLISLPPLAISSEKSQPSIHQEVIDTYNFHPHTLSHAQIEEKSAMLDKFWSKASEHKEIYVPALRQELSNLSNPSFFLYDGSKLLLSLSKEPKDRTIVLAAISHSDLQDLQLIDYFFLVHGMAAQGDNTTEAAFHVLEDPAFKVFIPQHVLTLAQNYSLAYMLFPTAQSYWEPEAIARLQQEKDSTAQQSLLMILFYAQTKAADDCISAFAADISRPAKSRDYARELKKRTGSIGEFNKSTSALADQERLRQQRRERMKSVSDEALMDFDEITAKIIVKRK